MKHGIVLGTLLGVTRVSRCIGVFFKGGEDHVPDRFAWKEVGANYRKYRRRKMVDE